MEHGSPPLNINYIYYGKDRTHFSLNHVGGIPVINGFPNQGTTRCMISTNISKALASDPSRPPRSRRVSKGSTADVAIPWHVAANAPRWSRGKHPGVGHPKCLKVVRGLGVSKGWLAVANQVGIFLGVGVFVGGFAWFVFWNGMFDCHGSEKAPRFVFLFLVVVGQKRYWAGVFWAFFDE